jgi:xylulokinase
MILGTSGYLAGHMPYKKTDIIHALTTIPSPIWGKYLIMAELGNTGKVLESYLYNLVYPQDEFSLGSLPEDVFTRLDAIVSGVPPGSGGVLFLPWFNGSLSPEMDYQVRGGFLNISHHTRREHLSRAVLEGIALNWRWLVEAVQHFTGRVYTSLRLGGGGAQSAVWGQIMADVLGIPIHQLAEPRLANVRGAAFLALDRLGWLSMETVPQRVEIARVFEPLQQNRQVYNRLYKQFRACYKTLKPVFHALNRS